MPPREWALSEPLIWKGPNHLAHCNPKKGGGGVIQEEDTRFQDLQRHFKKPQSSAKMRAPWISEATWRLTDQNIFLCLI